MMRILLVAEPVSSEALKTVLGFSKGACTKCALDANFEITTMADTDLNPEVQIKDVDFVLIEFDPNRAQILLHVDDVLEQKKMPHAFYSRKMTDITEGIKAPVWPGNGFRLDLITKIIDHYLISKAGKKKLDCVTRKAGI
jgi:hypothetical protein